MKTPSNKTPWHDSITPRELEVLQYLADGATTIETSTHLSISELTVKKHKENLLRKANARNAVHLVAIAFKTGLI